MENCNKLSKKYCMACKHTEYCDKANRCDGKCGDCDDYDCDNNPNKSLKQAQKSEAIERLKMLKLHKNVLREFTEENKLNLSENGGILYWLDEKQQEYVNTFETKYNTLVYHVIHSFTEFGELLSFLYVSANKDEWEYDRDDLKSGYPIAYVKNIDDDICSEFGSIGIKPSFGGLIRTA